MLLSNLVCCGSCKGVILALMSQAASHRALGISLTMALALTIEPSDKIR